MVDTKMIKAQMTLHEYTIDKLAKEMGVSAKTLSTRLNISPQKFTQEQIEKIVTTLKIKDPVDIFFKQ